MKLTVSFPELESQRQRMGAKLSQWEIAPVGLSAWEKLHIDLAQEGGIVIDDMEKVVAGPEQLFTYEGVHILVHVKDTELTQKWAEETLRFHLVEGCSKLAEMRNSGRFDKRYIATRETSGVFSMKKKGGGRVKINRIFARAFGTSQREERESVENDRTMKLQLKACKLCLAKLGYRGYTRGTPEGLKIWESFDIEEFFRTYSKHFTSPREPHDDI